MMIDLRTAKEGELAPCPFCGEKAEIVHVEEGENAGGSCVCCTQCLASSNIEFEFKENFVSNWNRRALPKLPGEGEDDLDQSAIQAACEATLHPPFIVRKIVEAYLASYHKPDIPVIRVEIREYCTLNDCPEGIFLSSSGNYGFMTEYITMIRNNTFAQRDAYVVESGEYWWGGTSDPVARSQQIVRPVILAAAPSTPTNAEATREEVVKHMVSRFLAWKLPQNFNPDCGITYTRPDYHPSIDATPSGTNLFDATQAEEMVRHMITEISSASLTGGGAAQEEASKHDKKMALHNAYIEAGRSPRAGYPSSDDVLKELEEQGFTVTRTKGHTHG